MDTFLGIFLWQVEARRRLPLL